MGKCLYCYQALVNNEVDFHTKCSKRFFGTNLAPTLNFSLETLKQMAQTALSQRIAVTGVQSKLSLSLEKVDASHRLTIVGIFGNYILKPPTEFYFQLPENEDLTMKLAAFCGIQTAEHTLIRLDTGELAYLTKRFDRRKNSKIHVEDFCQLTETLTEHKYRSSMEKIGKTIRKFSTNTGLNALIFFELTVFCYLTGNADMHLKNFSLIKTSLEEIQLSPAYDLVSTKIAMPDDVEEMALTMNGKKNRLKKSDFIKFGESLGINPKVIGKVFQKFSNKIESMRQVINESFLNQSLKDDYFNLILERSKTID